MDMCKKGWATVYCCKYHVVLCTKYKRPIFQGTMAEAAKEIFRNIADDHGFLIQNIEVYSNHVRFDIECNPETGLMTCIRTIKSEARERLKQYDASLEHRLPQIWIRNVMIFTVGKPDNDAITKFINEQRSDSKRRSQP